MSITQNSTLTKSIVKQYSNHIIHLFDIIVVFTKNKKKNRICISILIKFKSTIVEPYGAH